MLVQIGIRQRKWPTRIYKTQIVGYIELSNLDINDNIPYERYYDGKDIFNYLTFIGQTKIKNVYMVPTDELYDISIVPEDKVDEINKLNEADKTSQVYYDWCKRFSEIATPMLNCEGIPNKYLETSN